MTRTRWGFIGAIVMALSFSGAALAQTDAEQPVPDPGNTGQMEMMDGEPAEAPVDPASPEADGINGTAMEGEATDMSGPGEDAAPEDAGPADMISDSSERALSEAELEPLTCEELWIARNEIFDRNGYCFRSERGADYFDNSDCTSDSQEILSPLEWDNVSLIKRVEAAKQCT